MQQQQQVVDYSKLSNYKQVTIPPDNQKCYLVKHEKLGIGSFADTHLATLKSDETQAFACKCIQKDKLVQKIMISNNPEEKKSFFLKSLTNEVKVWMHLRHENIVQFVDFSETQNNYYLLMELCNNGDLDTVKKDAGGRLKELQAIILFSQLSNGCRYLYEKGVFHRDLKPANVLIKDGIAKIADFGFCKMLDVQKDEKMYQTAVGTPYYMSPQILAGEKYSIKCDVWSLGVIFYEAICGQYPWTIQMNSSPQELLNMIIQNPIQFPQQFQISQDTQFLINRMLTLDEDKRFSMSDVDEYTKQLFNKYVNPQQNPQPGPSNNIQGQQHNMQQQQEQLQQNQQQQQQQQQPQQQQQTGYKMQQQPIPNNNQQIIYTTNNPHMVQMEEENM